VKDIKRHFKDHQKMEAARRKFQQASQLPLKIIPSHPFHTMTKGKPEPPPDDGDEEWKTKQEVERFDFDPPGLIQPPRWREWLQYTDEVGPSLTTYYFNIETKQTSWNKPEGWDCCGGFTI